MTDFFRDKTYLWSPEQLEEVASEWGSEGCEVIASDMTPEEYRESMRENPRHADRSQPFTINLNTLELALWSSLTKMERQNRYKAEGRWDPAYGPTPMDLRKQAQKENQSA